MKQYTVDDIEEFEFDESRGYKKTVEKGQYIRYAKNMESVVFNDKETGHCVSVIREVHEDDDYDSFQGEETIKQKVYRNDELKKAEAYFLSDRK